MGFYEKDWYMRQLNMCLDMASSMLLGKPFVPYETIVRREEEQPTEGLRLDTGRLDYQVTDQAGDLAADTLHIQLVALLNQGDVDEGENLLFDSIDPENMEIYRAGLDFYHRLNQLPDKELAALDFSREEIRDGLSDFCEEYGAEGLFDELKLSWRE